MVFNNKWWGLLGFGLGRGGNQLKIDIIDDNVRLQYQKAEQPPCLTDKVHWLRESWKLTIYRLDNQAVIGH